MSDLPVQPHVHHVVFAVHPKSFDSARNFLHGIGFQLAEFVLDDLGLRVRMDWTGGVELVTTTENHVGSEGSVGDFLARHGEGVFSVVVRVADADRASSQACAAGAAERYRQHRAGSGFELTEVQMDSLLGLPITFLETDLQ